MDTMIVMVPEQLGLGLKIFQLMPTSQVGIYIFFTMIHWQDDIGVKIMNIILVRKTM